MMEEEQLIVPEHIATEVEASAPPLPATKISPPGGEHDNISSTYDDTEKLSAAKQNQKNLLDVFAAIRDASVYADKGIISIGDFQYVRIVIVAKGDRIRNPFMSHLFRCMVDRIIVYAIVNSTLPSARLLKQWQIEFMYALLAEGRVPPPRHEWIRELQDEEGVPPPHKERREAENDASYKVKVAIRTVRSKSMTPVDIPSYIQLPRISYVNMAVSLDLSSLPIGLHDYVVRLISHIGDAYAFGQPFVPKHSLYKELCKSFDAANGATAYKPDEETVRKVIEPRVHLQRAEENLCWSSSDKNEDIEMLKRYAWMQCGGGGGGSGDTTTTDVAAAAAAMAKFEGTPYDAFFYKYFYGKEHLSRAKDVASLVSEQAESSLERAREEERLRREREKIEWKVKGVEMVKKAIIEQRLREQRLGLPRKETTDSYYFTPPQSPMPTPEQLEAAAQLAVANATWEQHLQQQQQQESGGGGDAPQQQPQQQPQPQQQTREKQQKSPQKKRQRSVDSSVVTPTSKQSRRLSLSRVKLIR